jgi:hypothetical protein
VLSDDPNDDEAGDDPNDDDDAWEDPIAVNDTDVPITVWPQELVPYPITPASVPATWTETPSSPFPTLQRLRC